MLNRFDGNHADWIEATGAEAWTIARQHARVLQPRIKSNLEEGRCYSAVRDFTMAESIRWIREREGPDAKVIVRAQNTHVANWQVPESSASFGFLGYLLREWYKSDVVILGALFGRGGFRALETGTTSRGLWTFEGGQSPEGTIKAAFAAAGLDLAVVDLRRLPVDGPEAAWFAEPQPTRNSGGVFDATDPQRHFLP